MTSYQERFYDIAHKCLWLSEFYPDERDFWLGKASYWMVRSHHGE